VLAHGNLTVIRASRPWQRPPERPTNRDPATPRPGHRATDQGVRSAPSQKDKQARPSRTIRTGGSAVPSCRERARAWLLRQRLPSARLPCLTGAALIATDSWPTTWRRSRHARGRGSYSGRLCLTNYIFCPLLADRSRQLRVAPDPARASDQDRLHTGELGCMAPGPQEEPRRRRHPLACTLPGQVLSRCRLGRRLGRSGPAPWCWRGRAAASLACWR
jgi:hypothetical protein